MNRAVICERITLNRQHSQKRDAVIAITISLPVRLYPLKLILAAILIMAARFEETYVIDGDLATHATNSRAPFKRTYLSLQISTIRSPRKIENPFAIWRVYQSNSLKIQEIILFSISSTHICTERLYVEEKVTSLSGNICYSSTRVISSVDIYTLDFNRLMAIKDKLDLFESPSEVLSKSAL